LTTVHKPNTTAANSYTNTHLECSGHGVTLGKIEYSWGIKTLVTYCWKWC